MRAKIRRHKKKIGALGLAGAALGGLLYLLAVIAPKPPLIALVVAEDIYPKIEGNLTVFIDDLKLDGYRVEVLVGDYDAVSLRPELQALRDRNLVGAILIGDIPPLMVKFNVTYQLTWADEIFPCDLYLMDLDGNWTDTDGDGFIDYHTGDVELEIWVGRLIFYLRREDGVWIPMYEAINEYLLRNHEYRTLIRNYDVKAFVFLDDALKEYRFKIDERVKFFVPEVRFVYGNFSDEDVTFTEFITNQTWSLVHFIGHGSQHAIAFYEEVDGWFAWDIRYEELRRITPNVVFYNLMACRTGKYYEWDEFWGKADPIDNCISEWFLYKNALAVIGSSKKGGMVRFTDVFYRCWSNSTLGDSFVEAMNSWMGWLTRIDEISALLWGRRWFYGLTIFGDPTLSLKFSWRLRIYRGWNLISIPLSPVNATVEVIFGEYSSYVWIYAWYNGTYYQWGSNLSCPCLKLLIPGLGYFIFSYEEFNVTVRGYRPLVAITLSEGWHYVGVIKSRPNPYDICWAYDAERQVWIVRPYYLEVGRGYAVFFNQTTVWRG